LRQPARTLVIVCGASRWPALAGFLESSAFAKSAETLREYLLGSTFGLAKSNLLWLFDEPDSVSQYDLMRNFLVDRFDALDAPRGSDVTVLWVYIGHGTVFDRDLCLLLSDTRKPIEEVTSICTADLARLMRNVAPESGRFLILDCCFAGSAAQAFQAPVEEVVRVKTEAAFKMDRGVTLMCASSAENPAKLDLTQGRTMFTGELVDFLREGDPKTLGELSARRVCEVVSQRLADRVGDDAPRAESHSPNQHDVDLADAPLFPNVAAKTQAHEITFAEAASLRAAQGALERALKRTWSLIEALEPAPEPEEILQVLEHEQLLNPSSVGVAMDLLGIDSASLDACQLPRDQATRLILFDRTVTGSLAAECFQNRVINILTERGWSTEIVEDSFRQKRAWLPDWIAERDGVRLLVAPKTATRTDSKLLRDAMRRLVRQAPGRGVDAVAIVVPDRSKAAVPDDAPFSVLNVRELSACLDDDDPLQALKNTEHSQLDLSF
jgi:hypothetical protein